MQVPDFSSSAVISLRHISAQSAYIDYARIRGSAEQNERFTSGSFLATVVPSTTLTSRLRCLPSIMARNGYQLTASQETLAPLIQPEIEMSNITLPSPLEPAPDPPALTAQSTHHQDSEAEEVHHVTPNKRSSFPSGHQNRVLQVTARVPSLVICSSTSPTGRDDNLSEFQTLSCEFNGTSHKSVSAHSYTSGIDQTQLLRRTLKDLQQITGTDSVQHHFRTSAIRKYWLELPCITKTKRLCAAHCIVSLPIAVIYVDYISQRYGVRSRRRRSSSVLLPTVWRRSTPEYLTFLRLSDSTKMDSAENEPWMVQKW